MHTRPVPRTGGAAIYLGWLVAVVGSTLVADLAGLPRVQLLGLALAGTLAFGLGIVDDARGLPPRVKFVGQIAVGVLAVISGTTLDGGLPSWLAPFASVVWIVGLMNAMNLLDGLDGLAAGVTTLGAAGFGALAIVQGNTSALVLAAALLGSSLAFLRHNLHPATMFMGDGGSLFLGFQLAVLGVVLTKGQVSPTWLFAPVLVLGVPLVDTLGAIARRLRARRPLFFGDRRHVYDLLIVKGLSHSAAVRATWVASGIGGFAAFVLVRQSWGVASLVILAMAGIAALAGAVVLGLFSPDGEVSSGPGSRGFTGEESLWTKLGGHDVERA